MHPGQVMRDGLTRATVSIGGALVLFLLAAPVSAKAPADQYNSFYTSDPDVTDDNTKLTWNRYDRNVAYPQEQKFADAKKFCSDAGTRLPTLKELLTIVDEAPHNQYFGEKNERRYIDVDAFYNTPSKAFWTSSLASDGISAYVVDFTTGLVKTADLDDGRNVRCVVSE